MHVRARQSIVTGADLSAYYDVDRKRTLGERLFVPPTPRGAPLQFGTMDGRLWVRHMVVPKTSWVALGMRLRAKTALQAKRRWFR